MYIKPYKLFKENKDSDLITHCAILLRDKYIQEYGVAACDINRGECMNYAEELYDMLMELDIKGDVLSDGMFYDPFDDMDPEDLDDPSGYGTVPDNFKERGMPSHYFYYYNNKCYDSDSPEGVYDMFELKTFKDYYK